MFSAAPKRGRSKRCKPQQLKLSLGSSSGASGSCLPTGPNSRGRSSGKDDAPMVSRTSTSCTMAGMPARGTLRARARMPEFLSKWPPLRESNSWSASSLQACPGTLAACLVREEGFYHQNERAVTCVDYHLDSEHVPEFLSKWPPLRERRSCSAPSLQASPRTLAACLVREEGFYHQNERAITCVDYHLDSERVPEFSKWPPLRERSSCFAASLQASPGTLAACLGREECFYHQNERAVTCVDYHLDSERVPEFLSKWPPPLRKRSSCFAPSLQASPGTLAACLVREEGFYHQNERAVTCVDYHLDSECSAPSLQASPRTLAACLVREESFYHQNERAVTCVDYHLDSDPMEASLSELVTQLEMKRQEAWVEDDCWCYLEDANGNVIGWPPHKYSSL